MRCAILAHLAPAFTSDHAADMGFAYESYTCDLASPNDRIIIETNTKTGAVRVMATACRNAYDETVTCYDETVNVYHKDGEQMLYNHISYAVGALLNY